MPLVCPNCRQGLQVVGKFAVCPDHGQVEPVELADGPAAPGPADRPKVFISYGRKDARELVDRLCVDLAAAGFDVWRDTREIRGGTDWQAEIADGLRRAQVVVAVMTPHSVRRPNGHRHDGIARALIRGLPIVPVMGSSATLRCRFSVSSVAVSSPRRRGVGARNEA